MQANAVNAVQGRIYVELGVSTWVSYKKNIPNTVVMKMETIYRGPKRLILYTLVAMIQIMV